MTLPEPVQGFFDLPKPAERRDVEAIFAASARVRDEAKDHEGIDEITAWWREANEATPFTAEPKSIEERDGLLIVHAEVSGSFPGSPVMLGHSFALRDGKIEELEIK